MRLGDLLDIKMLRKLAEANYSASGMPIGIIDAVDGSVLVGFGWQDICTLYHRANPMTVQRCRESDDYIKANLSAQKPCEYTCRNGLRDIGVPISGGDEHLATLFLGQFFYEGEAPDRAFFVGQAHQFGFDETAYLAALDRVPVFSRATVENILKYNVALARFISDLADAALRTRKVEDELRDANRAKDDFLAMLSHELRNPLAPIRNSLYLLDNARPTSEQARRARAVARRQLTHLSRLVDDLLDVTKIVRGKVELHRAPLEIIGVVARTADDYRTVMEERGLELKVSVPDGPVWIDGDETRIAQVIGNLLRNAAKFTPSEGEVVVTVEAHPHDAEIRVRDTGTGIDPELVHRIFDPFVQAKQSIARTEGGLGLGLALVKGLVELHGGTVAVTSTPGQGTTFTVRFPLIAGVSRRKASRTPAPQSTDVKLRVLVVDDNRDAAESLADVVQMLGHTTMVAFDGNEAIRMVENDPPDIVLCDIGLPGISGYEIAQRLRSDHRFDGVQLVAVTGYVQPEDRQRALAAGFTDHIGKPPDPERVLRLLSGKKSELKA